LSSKRPLVVVVGAKWCAPCKQLKETVLPKLQLGRKILVKIDHDDDRELVNKITSGAVPQIIRYRYEGDKGWMVTKMTGLHSVEEVQKFVDEE
jgi:thioredoxin-like negative regulator of GroEL